MVLDLHERPAWLDEVAHQVTRVESAADVDVFRGVMEQVFRKDCTPTAGELLHAIRIGSVQHVGYVAFAAGAPAAIGRLYTHPRSAFGGLYGGGTLPNHRGQGLYRATVAARGRDASKLGARYLIVDAMPTSRPILERLGFFRLSQSWPCVLSA